MATPQQISVAVLASATTLYTGFTGGAATRAELCSLDLCNTTTGDLTIDLYYENSGGGTTRYFAKTMTVPALGTISYKGLQTIAATGDKWKAIASGTGIDATGTVVENA